MEYRTIDANFTYQMKKVFELMKEDYNLDQKSRSDDKQEIQTFSEWLWFNKEDFGELAYERFDEYCGIDEFTEEFNYKN